MKTIIWFIYFVLYLVALVPKTLKINKLEKKGETEQVGEMVDTVVAKWAGSLLKVAGVKVTVVGQENIPDSASVFVSNHEGNFDIPVLLTALPKPYGLLAKKELLKLPVIRTWMHHMGCIFVDRADPRASMRSLNEACDYVKKGNCLTIFPEGTRGKTGIPGDFKGGSFRIATKAKVPVVPILIDGTRDRMENNGGWINGGNVTVTILPAVTTANLTKEEQKALPDTVRELIVAQRNK